MVASKGNEVEEIQTLPGLRRAVLESTGLECADLDEDDDLVSAGVDSMGIMQFANDLRVVGIDTRAAELMEVPTLGAWLRLVRDGAGKTSPGRGVSDRGPDLSGPVPLTAMQHAYWAGRIPGHPLSVASHFYCELDGAGVDAGRLERAAFALTRRHPMLRTRFLDDGRQEVMPESTWAGVTTHEPADVHALATMRDRESHRRLAVDTGEVFDIQLSRLPDGRTRVHINVDMLVADAVSFRIVLDELAQLYDDPDTELAPIGYDVVRYHADQERQRETASIEASKYWRERLDTLPGPPALPLAVDPAALDSPRVTKREHRLSIVDTQLLHDRCREHGVTTPMVLATAFAEVIGRWCAEPRFVLNLPLFDRRAIHPDVPVLVGDFTNLLLLAVDLSGDVPFAERAAAVQTRFRQDMRHSDYSGMNVLRDLARRSGSMLPVAPVVFTSALGMGEIVGPRVRRAFGRMTWMVSQTSQVWLDHQVTEHEGGLLLNWDAVEALFPEGCLDAMFEAYVAAVQWLLAPGSRWDTRLPATLPEDQAAVRRSANDTAGETSHALLHHGFLEQQGKCSSNLALLWADSGQMTYGELHDRARALAVRLQSSGVAAGEPVAISMPRGPQQVVAVLGILMAGANYVPIGADVPVARRDRILTSAGVSAVVCSTDALPPALPADVRPVLVGDSVPVSEGQRPVQRQVTEEDVAYTIFTSGSTGEPKGVMVSHAAAANTVEALNARCGLGPSDRVLAVSALDFDLSVYDIFGPLSVGGAVVLVEEAARRDAERWLHLVRRYQVTLWQSVPTLLEMLLATEGDLGSSLRFALVGGDWPGLDLRPKLARRVPGCRLVALGGTTETAIHSTWYEVDDVPPEWPSVPWGTPLRNVVCRVVDGHGRDCPDWVPGELWIGGRSVAIGYRGDAERTARQFVSHQGTRWYRTGDIARYHPDGNLEFLGRRDHQVKVRGHRIELGEVEAAFNRCPGVREAVAVGLGEAGARRLAVAVTLDRTPNEAVAEELRGRVAEDLPAYMVPDHVTVFDELPLSKNGKIDRPVIARNLVDSAVKDPGSEPPDGPTEVTIAGLWHGLLDVRPGRTQSFFALGGDSLSATKFVQEARRALGVEIPMRQLFDTPTIAELAVAVEQVRGPGDDDLIEEGAV